MLKKIILLISVSLLVVSCSESVDKSPIQKELERILPGYEGIGFTNDDEPIEIILRSTHKKTNGHTLKFLIPKAYLTRKGTWKGGQEGMEIQTGFPEYLPRPAVKRNRKKLGDPGYDEAKAFSESGIYMTKGSLSASLFEKTLEERSRLLSKNIRDLYNKKYRRDKAVYSLERYAEIICVGPSVLFSDKASVIKKDCKEGSSEFFLTPEDYLGHWTAFTCFRLEEDSGVGCTAETKYKRKSLTYGFRRSQLYRWQEVDAGVRNLLDRFLIEESTNDKILYTRN